ncbi:glycerophosphodiester phosphodiesterase family protein [Pontibacter vulgaris]|uniref:glycerophosphodiester phosphodiesterase family protein n=1 Tax=Pontibacter vulgaris TaxID=2905679 RepID=UPI001FA80692|nr:glycerophosphodiester phosphodiesterase family protein [Pontibacter vulgaris]
MVNGVWPQVHGHRGCRGLMPENTIAACLKAVDLGVDALELDVVITYDRQVLVSHEAYFSSEFCLLPDGSPISPFQEKDHNIFRLPYSQIKLYDSGSKLHPRFPAQEKMRTHKPLLQEVIAAVEQHVLVHNLRPVGYNIELKSFPEGDHIFHLPPEEFTELVMQVLQEQQVTERCMIQSFDKRPLQILHRFYPEIKLGLLVEDDLPTEWHLQALGFYPYAYNPQYKLLTRDLVNFIKAKGMRICTWTVNEPEHVKELLEMGVDAIITDFPDFAVGLCQLYRNGATNP